MTIPAHAPPCSLLMERARRARDIIARKMQLRAHARQKCLR